jgi:ABC-type branched-subunit amino acid transport system substrate-binding protein
MNSAKACTTNGAAGRQVLNAYLVDLVRRLIWSGERVTRRFRRRLGPYFSAFTAYLRKLQSINPEFLSGLGHPPGVQTLIKQAVEMGFNSKYFIGAFASYPLFIDLIGEAAYDRVVEFSCIKWDSPEYISVAQKFYQVTTSGWT